jgi:F0F1-type ATP synthase membrane subunit a
MGQYKKIAMTAAIALLVSGGVVYASNNVKGVQFLKEKAA